MADRLTRLLWLARFFRTVPPVPRLLTIVLVGITIIAAGVLIGWPDRAGDMLTPVLMVQLFAASSGFLLPARRGHYDLLFTTGHSRVAIAVAHWLVSVLPGVMCWLMLGMTEWVVVGSARRTLLTSGTAVAVALVSTLPWAATVPLPRFAGAIGWLLVVALASSTMPASLDGLVLRLIYPPALVGDDLSGPQVFIAGPALVAAAAAMAYAFVRINRGDIPLEAAQ